MYRIVTTEVYSVLAQVATRTEALVKVASIYSESVMALHMYQEDAFSHAVYASIHTTDDQDGYRLSLHNGKDGRQREYSHSALYSDVLSALSALPGLLTADQSLYLTIEPTEPRIVTTYETVTPESAEHGDFEDCGFEDESGVVIRENDGDTTDQDGAERRLTVVELAVNFLRDKGVTEPSCSPTWSRGTWYSTEPQIEDYSTAEEKSYSYHPKGFTADQERAIYSALFPQRTN